MKLYRITSVALLALLIFLPASASSIWYVDGVNGSDNNNCKTRQTACKTIGHAISLASPGDTIGIGPATYTENLTINFSLNLIGSGALGNTIIDGGGINTVVAVSSTTAHVSLANLLIRNGHSASGGGGIYNAGTLRISTCTVANNNGGSGIYNAGALTIKNSGLDGNYNYRYGGAINNSGTVTIANSNLSENLAGGTIDAAAQGGAIYNSGSLTIDNSTLNANSAYIFPNEQCTSDCVSQGGGIFNAGVLTLNNTTLSANTATTAGSGCSFTCTSQGGGVFNGGMLTLNNSTLTGNMASGGSKTYGIASGGGLSNGGTVAISNSTVAGNTAQEARSTHGGGIDGSATLQNTIVANNTGGNCSGTMTSKGYNLSSDSTCSFNGQGDLNNTDPKLGTLANYGGPTQTIPLLSGSPAIDAGNPNGCTDGHGNLLKTDQRGAPRPDKEDTVGCDMGAYERQSD